MNLSTTQPSAHLHPQACPRCENESYSTLYRVADRRYCMTDRRYNIVECSNCALMRLDPLPSSEEIKSFYPENYWRYADESALSWIGEMYRKLALRNHVHFISRALNNAGPLLDIGCGSGSFVHAVQEKHMTAFGLDTSWKVAKMATAQFCVPTCCGALPNLPFRQGSFGIVTMFHVLEHVPNPMACVCAISELLAPGGKLIVQVPNADCWQFLLLGEHWSGLDVPRHLTHFRANDLEELLSACGFEVRRRKFFSLHDGPAGLAASLAPQLEPVARRVCGMQKSATVQFLNDLLYFSLVVAAVPFALLEAAGAGGSSIMLEAIRTEKGK